jgi:hypothetical protein
VRTRLRARLAIEVVLGLVSLSLCVLTLVTREWIEELTGWDPDAGSGALEWGIVAGFGVAAVLAGALAARDRRQLRALPT